MTFAVLGPILGFGECRSGLSKKELEEECVARGSDGSFRETAVPHRTQRVGCCVCRGDMHEVGSSEYKHPELLPSDKAWERKAQRKTLSRSSSSSSRTSRCANGHWNLEPVWTQGQPEKMLRYFCRFTSRVCLWRAGKSSTTCCCEHFLDFANVDF